MIRRRPEPNAQANQPRPLWLDVFIASIMASLWSGIACMTAYEFIDDERRVNLVVSCALTACAAWLAFRGLTQQRNGQSPREHFTSAAGFLIVAILLAALTLTGVF